MVKQGELPDRRSVLSALDDELVDKPCGWRVAIDGVDGVGRTSFEATARPAHPLELRGRLSERAGGVANGDALTCGSPFRMNIAGSDSLKAEANVLQSPDLHESARFCPQRAGEASVTLVPPARNLDESDRHRLVIGVLRVRLTDNLIDNPAT